MAPEIRHNYQMANLTDQQMDKIVQKAGQMLNSETQSEETNMYDELLKSLAEETGLSVEEVERQTL